MRMYKLVAGVVGIAGILAGTASMPTVSSIANAAEKSDRLSTGTVADLYINRTWLWKDGAGYFQAQKRQFTAWSGTGKSAAYGEGVWFLKDGGTICFRAKWTSSTKSTTNYSCFEHKRIGKDIYARNTDKGDWYVLKGDDKQTYQEIKMLKAGDRVSTRIQQIKDSLAKPASAG